MDDLYIAKDIGKYNTSKLFVIINNFIEQIGDCMGTKPSSKRLPRQPRSSSFDPRDLRASDQKRGSNYRAACDQENYAYARILAPFCRSKTGENGYIVRTTKGETQPVSLEDSRDEDGTETPKKKRKNSCVDILYSWTRAPEAHCDGGTKGVQFRRRVFAQTAFNRFSIRALPSACVHNARNRVCFSFEG